MSGPDVREVTADYETWLAGVIDVVPSGLAEKHRAIAGDELRFLRGTYYLWLVRVADRLPDVLKSPAVPLVGDLHVENFGTWRDRDQVRRWGVNDLDELGRGPWLLDLLRLATSAALARHVHLDDHDVCAELLSAYADAGPGAAVDVSTARHLAALVPESTDASGFYSHLAQGAPVAVPAEVAAAAAGVAEPGWAPTWHEHDAGTGSLGHVRAVGVGPAADGRPHAREAKQLGPGTAVWAAGRLADGPRADPGDLYERVEQAVRGPAGATRVRDWQVRDLAPDVVRIELSGLRRHDTRRVLRSMAVAVADVHAADPESSASARAEAGRLGPGDLAAMVETMTTVTRADLKAWRASPESRER